MTTPNLRVVANPPREVRRRRRLVVGSAAGGMTSTVVPAASRTAVSEPPAPLPISVQGQVVARVFSRGWDRFAEQQAACGYCANPIRLRGTAATIDTATGEVLSRYDTATEPDGVTYVRCGNRRAAVCPSCSREYKGDMWHLLAAGAGGGIKGVPESVGLHPQVFATLTAPSFGPVHTTRAVKNGKPGQCHSPRKGRPWLCPHGRPTWCGHRHDDDDQRLGQPLCGDCYDYPAHVVWQWHAPELWRRFTIALSREVANRLGVPRSKLRDHARVSFAKVAEFQRRGVVHFHAIIRLDGPAGSTEPYPAPTVGLKVEDLADVVRAAAGKVSLDAPPTHPGDTIRRLRFGAQVDVRPVRPTATDDGVELSPQRVAAYIAKYATKACEDFGVPAGITGGAMARRLGVSAHACRLIDTATRIAPDPIALANLGDSGELPYAGLDRWLHMLGFRGHFATKSRRYSVTLGRLRTARRRWRTARLKAQRAGGTGGPVVDVDADLDLDGDETTLVVGNWSFAGIGWCTAGDAVLAAESAAMAREWREQRTATRAATGSSRPPEKRPHSGVGR